MYRVKKVYDWTRGGQPLFCIDPAIKWDLSSQGERKDRQLRWPIIVGGCGLIIEKIVDLDETRPA